MKEKNEQGRPLPFWEPFYGFGLAFGLFKLSLT